MTMNRKLEIGARLGELNKIAAALCAIGDREPAVVGRSPYTVAVARHHVEQIMLQRELAAIVRRENKMGVTVAGAFAAHTEHAARCGCGVST